MIDFETDDLRYGVCRKVASKLLSLVLDVLSVRCGFALVLLVGGLIPVIATAQSEVANADASVVRILLIPMIRDPESGSVKPAGQIKTGSGFVINDHGDVVTNNHVVNPDDFNSLPGLQGVLLIILDGGSDQSHWRNARVLWHSDDKDLAVIEADGLHRAPLNFSTEDPYRGANVFAIGFPGAADLNQSVSSPDYDKSTLTEGIVSGTRQLEIPGGTEAIIQHQATINPGNSGGPLLNTCGQVIGVNTLASAVTGAINFSIRVSELLPELQAQNIPFVAASHGCAPMGSGLGWRDPNRIGILAAILTALLALTLTLRRPRQYVVQAVERMSMNIREAVSRRAAPIVGDMDMDADWIISGFDTSGRTVRIALTRDTLSSSRYGLGIGRDPSIMDFAIDDSSISRCHARVALSGDVLTIEDLDSTHGTHINDQRLVPFTSVLLKMEAIIQLGKVKLRFHARVPARS